MKPTTAKFYWDRGSLLTNARLQFAPLELRREWQALQARSAITEAQEHLEQNQPSDKSWMNLLGTALQGAQEVVKARQDVLKRAEEHVTGRINSGDLVAVGFDAPRKSHSIPVEIERTHWLNSVNWDNSEIRSQGLHFVQVRLAIRVAEVPASDAKLTTKTTDFSPSNKKVVHVRARKRGRPAIGPYVKTAFAELLNAGEIDTNASAKSHFEKVRAWVLKNKSADQIDGLTFGDEGIRTHFSPLFKELKRNRKQ